MKRLLGLRPLRTPGVILVLLAGCVSRTSFFATPVRTGHSLEENLAIAQRFLTRERARQLVLAAHTQFPEFPVTQLKTFHIQYEVMKTVPGGQEEVMIRVSFAPGPADPQPVLNFCARWIQDQLNSFERPPSGSGAGTPS